MRDTATIDMFDLPDVAQSQTPPSFLAPHAVAALVPPAQPLLRVDVSEGRVGVAFAQAVPPIAGEPTASDVVRLDAQGAVRFDWADDQDDPDDATLIRVATEPTERCERGFLKLLHHRWLYACAPLYERRAQGKASFCLDEDWTRPRFDGVLIALSRKHQLGEIDAIQGMRALALSCFEQVARAKREAHTAAIGGQALLRTPRAVRHLDASCAVLARMFVPVSAIPMYGQV